MAIINDTDLLVVQKGGNNYTYSGAQLKDDMREFGSGGTSPTPSLAQVCAVGAATGTSIGIDGDCSIRDSLGVETVSVNGMLAWSVGRGGGEAAMLAANGAIWSEKTLTTGASNGRQVYCSSGNDTGVYGCTPTRTAESIANATPVDTSNFLNVLNKVELVRFEDGLTEMRYDRLKDDNQSRFLVHQDDVIDTMVVPHYLAEVCKQQQQLIENLTTRIEQLEADHASAMNNMEDDNGSSTY